MSDIRFDDEVVIVTGAGRRLGRLYAIEFARVGARVVVNDLDERTATRVVDEITKQGGQAVAAVASVADPAGAAQIIDVAVDRYGSVAAVVNNAGFARSAYVDAMTPVMLDDVLAVHIGGSFFLSQAAWPLMREQGYGRIVMTSSSAGMFGMTASANYAAGKAGVYGLTRALAVEGREHGITVNAVLPQANPLRDDNAPLDRDESKEWFNENWGTPAVDDYMTPDFVAAMDRRDPRFVTPLVVYLASRACTATGEAFAAGLGRFARVFVSEAPGWLAEDVMPTAGDVHAHFDAIMDPAGAIVPRDLLEESAFLSRTE